MTVCAIMQPTYLPWLGYFDLADQVDVFVLLDDVQFAKRTWQQRNRIKTVNGLSWLSVPVLTKGRFAQRIFDVEIAPESAFPRDHLATIEQYYRNRAGFDRWFDGFGTHLSTSANSKRLVDVNVAMICWLSAAFGVHTRMVRSSNLDVDGRRSQRLAAICAALGADSYLAPPGSREYILQERHLFTEAGVDVAVHEYDHPEYAQAFPPFAPYASSIDLLFNVDPGEVGACLRSGRRAWSRLDDERGVEQH